MRIKTDMNIGTHIIGSNLRIGVFDTLINSTKIQDNQNFREILDRVRWPTTDVFNNIRREPYQIHKYAVLNDIRKRNKKSNIHTNTSSNP